LNQHPAGTRGSVTIGNRVLSLSEAKVAGESVRLSVPGLGARGNPLVLEGRVRGDVMEGTVAAPGSAAPWRAMRAAQ
jgi:hypothetical protein